MKSTCPYCGVGCGVTIEDGAITGDLAHPANFGRLCVKGATLAQTLEDGARLRTPMIGGAPATWDAALDLAAAKFKAAITEYGPDSVAIYGSGQFLTEDYYVANKLMKGFIGSGNIDTNSRLCMASTVAGHVRAFGEDVVPCAYEDIDEADLLVFTGANSAWCHPVLFERAQAARTKRGTKIVVIDPRKTATAQLADLHLPIRPDADIPLFQALLCALHTRGLTDQAFIANHTEGFAEALARAQEADKAPATLGLEPALLTQFLDWFCQTPRSVTLFSQGVNQSAQGSDKVNAIINVHLASGRIGKPGQGPFSLTGQPNAMGGREVGGLANQLAAHLRFERAEDRALVAEFWRAPNLAQRQGLKAVELFDAMLSGKIKAIWIAGTNPAESLPRSARVRAALEACPFVIVADCWETETTRLAHVVLPAAGWSEKDGTVTNSERRISRQTPFRPTCGQAKPDWWMLAELGKRLGFTAAFAYTHPAQIFREHAALSAYKNDGARLFNLGNIASISDTDYNDLVPFQWPQGHPRLFGDGQFSTPSGRAQFIPVAANLPPPRDKAYPFVLNTGRLRDQWHTMTRTGFVPSLMESTAHATLAISPADAASLGFTEGDLLRITTRQGSLVLPGTVANGHRPGDLFAAMHWTQTHSASGTINKLVGARRDPHSGQPAAKQEAAAIEVLPAIWHGVLQSRAQPDPTGQFCSTRVPLAGGLHRISLSGWKNLPPAAAIFGWGARLCGAGPDDAHVELLDLKRRTYRLAILRDGGLFACLFIACTRQMLPDAEAIDALFKNPVPAARTALLAGGAQSVQRGRMICICHGVPETVITELITSRQLASITAIGAACKAGTNCGSCKGDLMEILNRHLEPVSS